MRNLDVLSLLADLRRRLDGKVTLASIAQRAGKSRFHLHRHFRKALAKLPADSSNDCAWSRRPPHSSIRTNRSFRLRSAPDFRVMRFSFGRFAGNSAVRRRGIAPAPCPGLRRQHARRI